MKGGQFDRKKKKELTTSGTDLDVQGSDAELLATGGDVLGSQHGSVGGGLVTVGLDLHTTGDTADSLTATGITQDVSLVVSLSRCRARTHLTEELTLAHWVKYMFSASAQILASQGLTNLRSVTWTKVSLKEAKIRATPKTSSPVKMEGFLSVHYSAPHQGLEEFIISRTLTGLGAEGDVLLSRAGGLLGRGHFECGGFVGR